MARGWETDSVKETHVYIHHNDHASQTSIPVNSRIVGVDLDVLVEFNSDDGNALSLDWEGGEGVTGTLATADLSIEGPVAVVYGDGQPGLVTFSPGVDFTVTPNIDFGSPGGGLPSQGHALIVIRYAVCDPGEE